jgi:kynureninase
VRSSGVDFLATGTLKYLLGTPGAAFLYVRRDRADAAVPSLSGWRGQRRPMSPVLDPAPGATRFATGTWMVPNAYLATAGMDLLFEAGPRAVERRVAHLVGTLVTALEGAGIEHRVPAEPERRAAIVVVPVADHEAVKRRLRERGVICTARDGTLRFSLHAYVTADECRRAAMHLHDSLHEPPRERTAHARSRSS